MLKVVVLTSLVTATVCFGVAATTGLGARSFATRDITLRPGAVILIPDISWSCAYNRGLPPAVPAFSCSPSARGYKGGLYFEFNASRLVVDTFHRPQIFHIPSRSLAFYSFHR
jgi:hypothetical protein